MSLTELHIHRVGLSNKEISHLKVHFDIKREMEGKYFTIHSEQAPELVLDVEDGSTEPCSHVVIQHHCGADSQLWYSDPITGTIRNKLTGFVFDYDCKSHQLPQLCRFSSKVSN